MPRLLSSITVRDLLRLLIDEDPEAIVIFSADYGDISHTQQALEIDGTIEEVTLGKSAYSRSGFEVLKDEPDEEDVEAGDAPRYLLIK